MQIQVILLTNVRLALLDCPTARAQMLRRSQVRQRQSQRSLPWTWGPDISSYAANLQALKRCASEVQPLDVGDFVYIVPVRGTANVN